ncbi:hypothetical protein CK203_092923 [Vitis vinifera]|uniref:Reverse transcriptase zinc-binding domain-containing protein n=1 Tax=Vitis vinifera TaxID=29760 RepID=A0A438EJI5_VITVI|nr:hypothetical protein CK203_092923 [Vitis vinifera]
MDRDKAPGPDGFTIAVFQDCWDVIKEDLVRVFENFIGAELSIKALMPLSLFFCPKRVGFFDQVLEKKGFSPKWRKWMSGCLSSVSYAVLVNGSAKGWVKASRGLRQEERNMLEGFRVGRNRTRVSHLQFADDIFFSNTREEDLQTLKSLLLAFGHISGLKVNLDKSNIYGINLDQAHISRLAETLDARLLAGLYSIWVFLWGEPQGRWFWDPVIERISRRLDGGKRHTYPSGEDNSHPILPYPYALLLFLYLSYPLQSLQKSRGCKGFFMVRDWGRQKRSFSQGNGCGGTLERVQLYGIRWSHRCPWKAIQVFQVFLVYSICGRKWGKNSFWEDLWWGDQPLGSQYPSLFRVVLDKNIPISSVLGPTRPFSWNLNFRRNLSDSEIEDLEGLMRLSWIAFISFGSRCQIWPLSSSGLFSVKSFFLALSQFFGSPQVFPSKFVWNSQVPFKVQSFIWLVAHKKGDSLVASCKHRSYSDCVGERNARIFEDKARNSEYLWDSIVFLASLWAFCSKSREKFVSLKKGTRGDIVAELEEETKIQEMTIGIVWSLGVGRCLEWGGGVWVVRGVVFWDNRCYSWRSLEEGNFLVSCRFKNCEDGFYWSFTGVYGFTLKMEKGRVNMDKSELIPVGRVENVEDLDSKLGCKVGRLPSTWGCRWVLLLNLYLLRMELKRDSAKDWLCGSKQYISKRRENHLYNYLFVSYLFSQLLRAVRMRLEQIQRDFQWEGGALE